MSFMRHILPSRLWRWHFIGAEDAGSQHLTYVITPGPGTYDYLFTLTNEGPDPLSNSFFVFQSTNSDTPGRHRDDGPVGWPRPGWESFFSIGEDLGANTTFLDWPERARLTTCSPGRSPLTGFGFTSTVLIFEPIQYSVNFSTSDFFLAEGQVPETATGASSRRWEWRFWPWSWRVARKPAETLNGAG